jgi:glycine cleavage system H protein
MSENVPNELLYTEDHEWVRQEGNLVTVGITQFAVDQLGDVTQVDLPNEGEGLKAHEVLGSVESVKAVSDVYAPVSGKVVKVNSPLQDSPEYVNEDPYDGGWMAQIEISKPG